MLYAEVQLGTYKYNSCCEEFINIIIRYVANELITHIDGIGRSE